MSSCPITVICVLNPRDGDIQTHAGILKNFSAKRLVGLAPDGFYLNGEENQVWQESFKALPLWSEWMTRQKTNYIHSNPVRSGLAKTARDYRWSSFRAFYGEESDPLLQVDREWWWPEDVEKLRVAIGEKQIELDKQFKERRQARLPD